MANFISLTTAERLAELVKESHQNPVILFKHSTTCPISLSVYQEAAKIEGDVNLVVMQTSRPVSDEIAKHFKIRHESPQALVVKNGEPVYHASHFDITADDINEAVNS